jgi:hypothetical protein
VNCTDDHATVDQPPEPSPPDAARVATPVESGAAGGAGAAGAPASPPRHAPDQGTALVLSTVQQVREYLQAYAHGTNIGSDPRFARSAPPAPSGAVDAGAGSAFNRAHRFDLPLVRVQSLPLDP